MRRYKEILSSTRTEFHPLNAYLVKNPPTVLLPRQEIKLLTYNLAMVPWVFDLLYPAPYSRERMEDFLSEHLNAYDIICFQECIGLLDEVKYQFLTICQKAGYFFVAQPKKPKHNSQYVCESGIIILSRFPIDYQEFLPFSYAIDGEGQSELGVIYAKIRLSSDKSNWVHVFNTHLQSSTNVENPQSLFESVQCREQQLKEMSSFIHAKTKGDISNPNNTVLICGDFNINALKESNETKEMFLEKHSSNHEFISYSEQEYFKMIEIFERGVTSSIRDYAIEEFGNHHKTFLYMILDKIKNKEYEKLNLNQCFDYILEKTDGIKIDKNVKIKKGSMKIEKFEAHQDKPYQALSDHCGISLEIEITNNPFEQTSLYNSTLETTFY